MTAAATATAELPAWSALSTSALLVRLTDRTALAVEGGDRVTWLNGLVTCDVAKVGVGQASYGLAVGTKGRILADLFLVNAPERVVLLLPRDAADAVRELFEHHLVMEDAEITPRDVVSFFAHGPAAAALASKAAAAGAVTAPLDFTGRGGALILADAAAASAVERALDAELAALGGTRADEASWRAVRVKLGLPEWRTDFDETFYPQEASLETRAVSFSKGCYLGQEVVCMLQMRGRITRKLLPIAFHGGVAELADRAEVQTEAGAVVGKVTSFVGGAEARGLALLKTSSGEPGTALRVGETQAQVVAP
jgi:folate-binding protein YgfZ